MAKTKKEKAESVSADPVSAQIIKEFGNGIIVGGDIFASTDKIVVPISPSFNIGTGGGVPEGSTFIVSGPEKCGKTNMCLHFSAKAQQPEFGNRNIYYHNIEERLEKRSLSGISGLNLSKFRVIGSSPAERNNEGVVVKPARIMNATEHLSVAENILRDDPGCVLILDSVSMLLTEGELAGTMGDMQRAEGARLMNKFCRRNAGIIEVNKSIVIMICHLMMNQNPQGKKYVVKGAMGVAYQADVNVQCTYFKYWVEGNNTRPSGLESEWNVVTAALPGGIPGTKFKSYMRFGHGIDEVYELFVIGKEMGLIEQAGAWYTLSFMEQHLNLLGIDSWDEKMCKGQGETKTLALLKDNPKWCEALQVEIMGMLQ